MSLADELDLPIDVSNQQGMLRLRYNSMHSQIAHLAVGQCTNRQCACLFSPSALPELKTQNIMDFLTAV